MANDEERDQIPLFGETSSRTPTRQITHPKPERAATSVQKPKNKPPVKVPKVGRIAKKEVVASGQVPPGDVRLTANIREDLHLRLKITAAKRRTTIGELIEELVEVQLPPI